MSLAVKTWLWAAARAGQRDGKGERRGGEAQGLDHETLIPGGIIS
jgi:hypothetical protein